MGKLFGTDGVRGVANSELTPELAFRLGRAAGTLLKKPEQRTAIILGKDTRISGSLLESALAAGICSSGVDVYATGVIPTPAIAFLTKSMNACAGAVISASHNPFGDNGIKFFNNTGYKLADELEEQIEALVLGDMENLPRPTGNDVGRIIYFHDAANRYVEFLKEKINASFIGLRIVVDCANGAVSEIASRVYRELGAQVITIHDRPTGININEKCGSTHIESLQEAVLKHHADLGIAHDGDGDRVIAVDEKGQEVDGDKIMVICGLHLQKKGELRNKIVVTVMSNMGLKKAFEKEGIEVFETKVGDRYVLEKMLEVKAVLGGEQSGHIIFLQHNSTGDGILTALHLLSVVKETGRPLSELAKQMTTYPQVLVNVRVKDKSAWVENLAIKQAIAVAEKALGGNGRLLVRPSGTEPLLRIMAEGENKAQLEKITEQLKEIMLKELG
ncbi:MAG: phosphoglucosamine mutase [Clostridia bacterium]|jgi:phosphoglucosamine mutase|nr:phosphoglucosamine mutase [Clostridia bacterium]